MLPACEKVIEIIVRQQLLNYFNDNNLFCKEQSGFRNNYLCETAINYVVNNWKCALDKKKRYALFSLI